MINIYGLKNCDSCRKAIKWLKDNNYSYEFFDIKVNPIKKSKIKEWWAEGFEEINQRRENRLNLE